MLQNKLHGLVHAALRLDEHQLALNCTRQITNCCGGLILTVAATHHDAASFGLKPEEFREKAIESLAAIYRRTRNLVPPNFYWIVC